MATNDIDEDITGLDRVRDLPIRSEEIGFAPHVMLVCDKCGRSNAPTRASCMYCGTQLKGSSPEPELELRELEIWENGYNVVITRVAEPVSGASEIAATLMADVETIEAIIASRRALPMARAESEQQASEVVDRLARLGIEARVIRDEDLSAAHPPIRLRGLLFGENELVVELFGKPESQRINREDLALIFSGFIFQARTESIEKRKRRSTETLSETETTSDDAIIDIYSRQDPTGWRIPVTGFDFSCLGTEKSLFAGENIQKLVSKLADYSPPALVVSDYSSVRSLLEHSWPNESRKDSLGPKRSGLARNSTSTVFSTNNTLQLTKYSRLQWHLL